MNAVLKETPTSSAPYKVAYDRGDMNTRLSSQWFSRPDDQRFTNLVDMHAACLNSAGASESKIVSTRDIQVRARSKNAPQRFMAEAAPALQRFSDGSDHALVHGVNLARNTIVAKDDDDRTKFLRDRKFTGAETKKILAAVVEDRIVTEGTERPAASIWDMVQGITAVAREEPHQDARVALERKAKTLLDKVA